MPNGFKRVEIEILIEKMKKQGFGDKQINAHLKELFEINGFNHEVFKLKEKQGKGKIDFIKEFREMKNKSRYEPSGEFLKGYGKGDEML